MNPVAVALAQDFAQAVIEAARDGEFVETFVQTVHTTKVQFQANKLKDANSREARGLGVRLRTAENRVGTFATSDFGDAAATLDHARSLAALTEPVAFEPVPDYHETPVQTTYDGIEKLTAEQMVERGTQLIDGLRGQVPAGLHGTELYKFITTFELANSRGAHAKYTHSEYAGYLITAVTRPDDQLEAYEILQSAGGEVDFAGPLQRLVAKVKGCDKGAKLPTGSYPVIFTPNALSTFHSVSNALNGKPVVEGLSSLRDAQGQQALSALLSILDDPTLPGGPMSYPLDDEGTPARQNILVDKGVVRGFLFDQRYGQKRGVGSTGNGIRCGRQSLGAGRSYQNDILPHASNHIIGAGNMPYSMMVEEMQQGVIVDSVMGVHTGNPISGDFSVNLDLALVVENGQVVGRLKDAMLSGNTFKLLKERLSALSTERHWVGNTLAPWFLIDGVSIATGG